MVSVWDNELIEAEVKLLWNEEGLSALAIANHVNSKFASILNGKTISRNSVVSKVSRLRDAGEKMRGRPLVRGSRVVTIKKARVRKPSKMSAGTPQQRTETRLSMALRAVPYKARHDESKPTVMSVAELEKDHCRWPIGDVGTPGFGFCGQQKFMGLPYCALHSSHAFQAPIVRTVAPLYTPAEKKERQLV